MFDRTLLIARVLPPADYPSVGIPPAPPGGFASGECSALGVFRGTETLWLAAFCRAELRAFGRTIARAALLGPPVIADRDADPDRELLDRSYRAVLDLVLTGSGAAHVLIIELSGAQEHHADVLWRLTLAMQGHLTIREHDDHVRLELYAPGRGGALAALVSARPYAAIRGAVSQAASMFSVRGRQRSEPLAILARDLAAPSVRMVARLPVQFSELPAEEVRRRPRHFGMGLAAVDALGDRRQFVGRAGGRIVFRVALHRFAPVLDLLDPSLRSTLAQPMALLTEAYTEPEFRNLSIFAAALQWSAEWAREEGIRTLIMLIRADNAPSLRAAIKGGFQRVGELTMP